MPNDVCASASVESSDSARVAAFFAKGTPRGADDSPERRGKAVGVGQPRVGQRERRVTGDGRLERSNRRRHRAGLALPEIAPAAQIVLVRVRITTPRRCSRDARVAGKGTAERDGDRASDAILDIQHVAELTGVLSGPEHRIAADIHESGGVRTTSPSAGRCSREPN